MKIGIKVVAWKNKTEAAKRRVKSSATVYVRNQAKKVLLEAVRVSAQWSGNFAYNWFLEVAGNQGAYDRRFKVEPWQSLRGQERQVGDPRVEQALKLHIEDMLLAIKWNSTVRLVNYAPVAQMIEDGTVTLRPQNLVPAGYSVIKYLEAKYKILKR
jgi:hypothetical protein